MYYMEIETNEVEKASEYTEKALKYMGKVMQCLSSWEDESGYGERSGGNRYGGSYGIRYDYGMRGGSMNYRDEEWDEDDEEMMHERRGGRRRRRDSRGRYL